jgi:putative peptidoglycan lipid II flippase
MLNHFRGIGPLLKRHSSFISRTSTLVVLAAVNLLVAFLYQWYIATMKGPGRETDALFAGLVVPTLILAVVSGSMTFVLIPMLSTRSGENFSRDSWDFFQLMVVVFSVFALVLFLASPVWVAWTVPGFDPSTVALTVELVKIQLLGVVFTGLTGVLQAVNFAKQKFIFVELVSIGGNILGFLFLIWAFPRFGIKAAAWAMVVRMMLQTVYLIPTMGPYRKPNWKSPSIKTAWARLRPLLIGTSYYRTDQLVDRIMASLAPRGFLTFLHLSQQIYSAGNMILSKAISTPTVPVLANFAEKQKWKEFRAYVIKRLILLGVITGSCFCLMVVLGKPGLSFVFAHRQFSQEDVRHLWILLVALGGVLIAGSLGQILSSSFYAHGDTKTPTRIGMIGFTLGLGLKIGGFFAKGILGLAVGTSTYQFLVAFVLYIYLKKDIMRKMTSGMP